MSYTEKDLAAMRPGDLLNAWDDLSAELAAAKEAARSGDGKERDKLREVKGRVDAFRTYWRTVDHINNPTNRALSPRISTGAAAPQEG